MDTPVASVSDFLQKRQAITQAIKKQPAGCPVENEAISGQEEDKRVFKVGDWVFLKLQPTDRLL